VKALQIRGENHPHITSFDHIIIILLLFIIAYLYKKKKIIILIYWLERNHFTLYLYADDLHIIYHTWVPIYYITQYNIITERCTDDNCVCKNIYLYVVIMHMCSYCTCTQHFVHVYTCIRSLFIIYYTSQLQGGLGSALQKYVWADMWDKAELFSLKISLLVFAKMTFFTQTQKKWFDFGTKELLFIVNEKTFLVTTVFYCYWKCYLIIEFSKKN